MMRTLFYTVALVCLLIVMAPTLRHAAHCPTYSLDGWVSCVERQPLTSAAARGIDRR